MNPLSQKPPAPSLFTRRLLELGHVTQDQLSMAETERRRSGDSLTSVLQALRLVTEEEVASVGAAILGLERIRLTPADVDRTLLLKLTPDFAKKHLVVPLTRDAGARESPAQEGLDLAVAMADPCDVEATDHIARLVGREPHIFVATQSAIRAVIEAVCGEGRSLGSTIEQDIAGALDAGGRDADALDKAEAVPLVQLVDHVIELAIRERATDIHVEPEEKVLRIRLRIDGLLNQGPTLPKELQPAVITRLKVMADLNISEKRLPQDGRIRFVLQGREYDLRVSSLPTAHGENIVLRILDKGALPLSLKDLGMPADVLEVVERVLANPYGIFLVTGPTGSGKSTTLYGSLRLVDSMQKKVVTVEDPIEYQIPLIRQCQVNPKAGLTFAEGLRSILRQDPDVILVGEIRDLETAQIAVRAGLTGHLVLSTLHTNSSVGAIPRLIDMGVEPFLLNSSILAVLAQRLARRLCTACRRPTETAARHHPLLDSLRIEPASFYAPVGCPECRGTGYRGRTGVFELLVPSDSIRAAIGASASEAELRRLAREAHMRTLLEAGVGLAARGVTSLDEVLRVIQSSDL
ncbi:MAG: GspE/PulE family protein [Planctomycetota bacterium]